MLRRRKIETLPDLVTFCGEPAVGNLAFVYNGHLLVAAAAVGEFLPRGRFSASLQSRRQLSGERCIVQKFVVFTFFSLILCTGDGGGGRRLSRRDQSQRLRSVDVILWPTTKKFRICTPYLLCQSNP